MTFLHILILALVQGAAELLPVSSSAHVIVAEKLLGIDPATPEATLVLVLLHTGTMLAVILYFWKAWRSTFFSSWPAFRSWAVKLGSATVLTGIVGLGLKVLIEKTFLKSQSKAELENIFGNLPLIAAALAAAGLLIVVAGLRRGPDSGRDKVGAGDAVWVGLMQGFCLPFRGLSRSGTTISTALLRGVGRVPAEAFSFALAVLLTPPVVGWELRRFVVAQAGPAAIHGARSLLVPGLFGMFCSFLAGLGALRWLSNWLEKGRWQWFGGYCLGASALVMAAHLAGFKGF